MRFVMLVLIQVAMCNHRVIFYGQQSAGVRERGK
jgi:hypothetical protein